MELRAPDLAWAAKQLPPDVAKEIKSRPREVIVAGGFIRACIAREEVADIDLFVKDAATARSLAGCLRAGREQVDTENAITLIGGLFPPIQIIHRWVFGKPEDVAPSFDFTIAAAAMWHDSDWRSMCDDSFYQDLAAKRLVYRAGEENSDTGGSVLRMLKFYGRGYTAPLQTIADIMARLVMGKEPCLPASSEAALSEMILEKLVEIDPPVIAGLK